MIAEIISVICMLAVIAVSVYIFISIKNIKEKLDNIVDEINASQLYAYNFDVKQDQNIQNLEENILRVNNKVSSLLPNRCNIMK